MSKADLTLTKEDLKMSKEETEMDKSSSIPEEDDEQIAATLMTLRKPTELKKIMDSVPKPENAVPKNGLPMWYKLGLDCKLAVPDMPKGKIVFSRGKVGEDIRKTTNPERPSFNLSDPYCYHTSYPYVEVHDPHLFHHFAQRSVRDRMKQLGYVTSDGRATCSLKDFNEFRKFLYRIYMDQINEVMKKVDEKARDDLVLRRVEWDVARRALKFKKSEKTRDFLERAAELNSHEAAEKLRLAKEQEKKAKERIQKLIDFKENQRKERTTKAREKENMIKQRVLAAAEMEIRRKITMIRQWRINEKRRLHRMKKLKEEKAKWIEKEANRKWDARVAAQTNAIENNEKLLNMYCEDMQAAAKRRLQRSQIKAYETDLELQRIRLANLKMIHGGHAKAKALVKKMGTAFEKATRGAKGMCEEFAQKSAKEAMVKAVSVQSDRYTCLGQARMMMDTTIQLPAAPVRIFEQILENAVMEFTRRRINRVLRDVETSVRESAAIIFFKNKTPKKLKWITQLRPSEHNKQQLPVSEQPGFCSPAVARTADLIRDIDKPEFKASDLYYTCELPPKFEPNNNCQPRSSLDFVPQLSRQELIKLGRLTSPRQDIGFIYSCKPPPSSSSKKRWTNTTPASAAPTTAKKKKNHNSIKFGPVEIHESKYPPPEGVHWKSVHNRPPTPVPSKSDLVEVTFLDRADDLPDPVATGKNMPERSKLIESINAVNKLLTKSVNSRVTNGMDLKIDQVTLPSMRHTMEWGEAVEGIATAAIEDRIDAYCGDVRRASVYLAYRILMSLNCEMKDRKKKLKEQAKEQTDFYNPEQVEEI